MLLLWAFFCGVEEEMVSGHNTHFHVGGCLGSFYSQMVLGSRHLVVDISTNRKATNDIHPIYSSNVHRI